VRTVPMQKIHSCASAAAVVVVLRGAYPRG
jgi:hypothetical protein